MSEVVYWVALIFIFIMMLNLLIAIISEKYAEVMNSAVSADYKEKCLLMLQVEKL